MPWKIIGGRGEVGDMNWGVDFNAHTTAAELKPTLKEIKKHIGETVLLTGGGGFGARTGKLSDAKIALAWGKAHRIKVKLTNLDPSMSGDTVFEPWLDSWQISIWAKQ